MTTDGSSPHPLDDAVALQRLTDDDVRARTTTAWSNMVGPFGGITSAVVVKALTEHPALLGDPLALTVNFAGPIADGEFDIALRPTRTNRSTQHWSVQITQNDAVVTTGSAVTGLRRDSWGSDEAPMPTAPTAEDLPQAAFPAGVNWVNNYDMRWIQGAVPEPTTGESDDSTTTMWVRDHPPRPLDHVSLASMADTFFPRIFLRQGDWVIAGTVTLSTYFIATTEQIAAQATDHVLATARTHRFHQGYHDQTAQLWGRDGTLLATSSQLVYFKR